MPSTQPRFVPIEADDTTAPAPANSASKGQRFVPVGPDDSPVTPQQDAGGFLERTDKAVTGALAPNPANYESLIKTNAIEVPKTLGREVYSAGKTALGVIPGMYHAVADPATEEEKESFAPSEAARGEKPGEETSGFLGRANLAVDRLSGLGSAAQGIKAYRNPATRPTYEEALSVAPEAIGAGAGTVLAAKGASEIAPKVAGAAKDAGAAALDKASLGIEKIKPYATAKNVGRVGGGIVGGKLGTVAVPGYGTVGGALEGAALGGKAAESLLGKERANTPFFKPRPKLPLGSAYVSDTPEPVEGESWREPEGFDSQAEPAPKKATQKGVEDLIQKGLGNEPEHLGQFARANGQELDAAIPQTKEGNALRSKIHDLTNTQVRQLAIKAGRDMGQDIVGRGKFGGSISRPVLFGELLKKYSPEDIGRLIDAEQISSYAKGTPYVDRDQVALIHEGEAIIPKGKNPNAGPEGQFSGLTLRLLKALGVSEEGKAALRSLGKSDSELQAFLVKLDSKDLDRLADGKLPRRRIRK
jgi:hypothetical protein